MTWVGQTTTTSADPGAARITGTRSVLLSKSTSVEEANETPPLIECKTTMLEPIEYAMSTPPSLAISISGGRGEPGATLMARSASN